MGCPMLGGVAEQVGEDDLQAGGGEGDRGVGAVGLKADVRVKGGQVGQQGGEGASAVVAGIAGGGDAVERLQLGLHLGGGAEDLRHEALVGGGEGAV